MAVPPAAAAVASTFDVMAVMVTFLLLRRCIRSAETVATCADVGAYLDQGREPSALTLSFNIDNL